MNGAALISRQSQAPAHGQEQGSSPSRLLPPRVPFRRQPHHHLVDLRQHWWTDEGVPLTLVSLSPLILRPFSEIGILLPLQRGLERWKHHRPPALQVEGCACLQVGSPGCPVRGYSIRLSGLADHHSQWNLLRPHWRHCDPDPHPHVPQQEIGRAHV